MKTIQRDIVSGLVFSKDGKLLMGMKDPRSGGVYADCWHLPGGGVRDGESKMQALRREMLEEIGLDVDNCRVELADDQGRGESHKRLPETGETVLCKMRFAVYRVDVGENAEDIKLQAGDDLQELRWFGVAALREAKLTPPSVELFKRLGLL